MEVEDATPSGIARGTPDNDTSTSGGPACDYDVPVPDEDSPGPDDEVPADAYDLLPFRSYPAFSCSIS